MWKNDPYDSCRRGHVFFLVLWRQRGGILFILVASDNVLLLLSSSVPDRPFGDDRDWLEKTREGDVNDDLGEVDAVVDVGVDVELVVVDLLDVVVEVEIEVSRLADVLGIGTSLSADDIKDRGGDNLDMTDLAIFSPGRSKFIPYFLRSRKFGNLGSDILTTGDSGSN